jgi:hypothetical protein
VKKDGRTLQHPDSGDLLWTDPDQAGQLAVLQVLRGHQVASLVPAAKMADLQVPAEQPVVGCQTEQMQLA